MTPDTHFTDKARECSLDKVTLGKVERFCDLWKRLTVHKKKMDIQAHYSFRLSLITLRLMGHSYTEIAEMFDVTPQRISQIFRHYERWACLKGAKYND